jgi:acetyl-CoA carboxylase biotin carboxyl carrier protein
MNAKELKDLVEFLISKDIAEFELERGDVKLRMKRGSAASAPTGAYPPPAAAASVPEFSIPSAPPAPKTPDKEPAEDLGLRVMRSPIVGTFYESPSPGAPAFVKVGDTVQTGQVLCIVEAMKLMNEIESDVTGTLVKRYVENAQPVEYGQPLFAFRVS